MRKKLPLKGTDLLTQPMILDPIGTNDLKLVDHCFARTIDKLFAKQLNQEALRTLQKNHTFWVESTFKYLPANYLKAWNLTETPYENLAVRRGSANPNDNGKEFPNQVQEFIINNLKDPFRGLLVMNIGGKSRHCIGLKVEKGVLYFFDDNDKGVSDDFQIVPIDRGTAKLEEWKKFVLTQCMRYFKDSLEIHLVAYTKNDTTY